MWSEIRKFGLEFCDLPTMLWNVSICLKVLTLNIYGKSKKEIPFIFYIIMIISSLCYFYVYLISVVWFVFVRSRDAGDTVAVMVVLSLGISSEIGTLKLVYMFLSNAKIRNMTDAFLEFDSQMKPDSRLSVNTQRYMRDVKKRAIFYWIVLNGNGLLYVFLPVIRSGRHLTEDLFVIYRLEPMFESPHYEMSWIMMATSVITVCYISANVTTYFIVIIGYAESLMLSLSDEVTHMWTDAEAQYEIEEDRSPITNDSKNKILNDNVYSKLKGIIKRHATIKTLLNQVEDVSRVPLAVGFILLVLGLITDLLGGLENTLLQLPFSFMQVGIDCYIGQRIMDAGEVFEKAVYDCKWENFDTKNMKLVLVMLQASQKPTTISAGGVAKMSFRCLMLTMRATYSAYTALRPFMK